MATTTTEELETPDMSLEDITDGDNGRGIPAAKFIDDVASFSLSLGFQPKASPELLIVAYTQLLSKYRSSESNLQSRRTFCALLLPAFLTITTYCPQRNT